jgi:hypothetical protein
MMAARLTPEQFKIASKARFGLIPRPPKSVVPSITVRDYNYVLTRWKRFSEWKAWRDVGGPRPPGVWTAVPKWDGYTPFELLEDIRKKYPLNPHPVPVPPPPPPHSLAWGQSWFVIAQDYRAAVGGPDYFGRAFVADHSYEHPTREEVAAYRARGVRTVTWGDSRVEGDGTSPQTIIDLANEIRTDGVMFQAELLREYVAATKAIDNLGGNGHLLIVNRSSIADDANLYKDFVDRITRGNIICLSECYKNCGWGNPDWGNLPMASTLGATYTDGGCAGCQMDTYYDNGWISAHRDSWYTAQWTYEMYKAAR